MEENQRLRAEVDDLQSKVVLQERLLELQNRSFDPFSSPVSALGAIAGYVVVPILLMVLLHYLLVVLLDARLIWLRVVTIIVPILCGYALEINRRPGAFAMASMAVIVAVGAVLSMSLAMQLRFDLPFMPRDAYERRELGEYAVSIALAYVLGVFIARLTRPFQLPKEIASKSPIDAVATILAHNVGVRGATLEHRLQRWRSGMRLAFSILTAAGMIWTGFSRFFQ